MKTACWFAKFPPGHSRIGISRGVPRNSAAGYRVYRTLAPGPWFHSVEVDEYYHLYQTEVLGKLDPRKVAAELVELARGGIPVMLCFEHAMEGQWCHRAMAAAWLAEALGRPIPELGFETLAQEQHPLMPPHLRRPILTTARPDLVGYVGREMMIDGELHRVVGLEADGQAIIAAGDRRFTTAAETVRQVFTRPV